MSGPPSDGYHRRNEPRARRSPGSEPSPEDSGADMDMCESPGSNEGRVSEVPYAMAQPAQPPLPPPMPWLMGDNSGGVVMPPPDPTAPSHMMMMINPFVPSMGYLPAGGSGGLGLPSSSADGSVPAIPPLLFPKEIVRVPGATFYPPNPKAPPPQTRDKPPGCRTIFIGGLPEMATEPILSALFLRCGEIQSLRMSKKNFAHIRYLNQDSIDRALYFSGYRLKVDDRGEKEYSGKMHVDYAQARDDQYEYECAQRALLREQRHRRSPSPSASRPPRPHYSDQEASQLLDKLKVPDTFVQALEVVDAWLDGGDCNKRSSAHFYSMVGAVNAHIRRLLSEKQTQDTELCNAKDAHSEKVQDIMNQFTLIEKTLRLARKQRNWDNFTKPQRKNLDLWLRQAEETRKVQEKSLLNERQEEAMETSDDEEETPPSTKKLKFDPVPFYQQQIKILREELQSLKNCRNETTGSNEGSLSPSVDPIQNDESVSQSDKLPEKKPGDEAADLEKRLEQLKESNKRLGNECEDLKKTLKQQIEESERLKMESRKGVALTEAKVIAYISTFLLVHPMGASIDYIGSYLRETKLSHMKSAEVELILERFPELFKVTCSGVGASMERKWSYIGLQ